MPPTYSFVIPIYNEEATIPEMYRRVSSVMDQMDGPVELILIDDGSRDISLQMLRDLHQRDERVCYLSLARNFGHQVAVTAGLNFARGQAIVVMDADLQDPPELISKMAEKWHQGYQVVYGQRTRRRQENWFKRVCAYLFYRLLRNMSRVDIPKDTGDFCLMDRKVVDLLNAMPERNRYIRGLRSWLGFQQTAIYFERDPRFAGKVKYSFAKSLGLAVNGLVSFSKVPLRIATYVGLFASVVALIMSLLVLYWRLFAARPALVGFAAISTVVFFLAAVQLLSIGILGEYIGHIYEEVKARPVYTLKEVCGFYGESLPSRPRSSETPRRRL